MERTQGQKLLAEFVGAFTLIFIGAGSIITNGLGVGVGLVGIALAHGLAIGVMVSAMGHISGAHFNPAVTIGAWVTQKIDARNAVSYIVAQLAGGAAGAAVLRFGLPNTAWEQQSLGVPAVTILQNGNAVMIEAVLTFFLVWVIFATAIDPDGAFGKIAGLAIGLTITIDILAAGPFTGAAMNPARWFGPAVVGGYFANWWVWIIGPVAGAIVAAVVYDSVILRGRGAEGSAAPGEAPHGWGAHGEDADAVTDSHDH